MGLVDALTTEKIYFSSLTLQPNSGPLNPRLKNISNADKTRIADQIENDGNTAAVFYVGGKHSYNYKTKNGSGSGSGSFNGIYYVPKDKVDFFLNSVAAVTDLDFDFIATV